MRRPYFPAGKRLVPEVLRISFRDRLISLHAIFMPRANSPLLHDVCNGQPRDAGTFSRDRERGRKLSVQAGFLVFLKKILCYQASGATSP